MRAALASPDRDALFTRVETAVRALKADADAQPAEDFADLRSDLRAAPEADGDTMTLILDPGETATAAEEADLGVDARTAEGMTPQAAAADDDARGEDAPEDTSGDEASSASPPSPRRESSPPTRSATSPIQCSRMGASGRIRRRASGCSPAWTS